jgi:hypothetical protein
MNNFDNIHEKITGMTTLMNAQFININDHLTELKKIADANREDIVKLKIDEIKHIINCPVSPKVEEIQRDLQEYMFIKKYPKIAIGLLTITIFLVLFNIFELFRTISSENAILNNRFRIENKIDSIKLR